MHFLSTVTFLFPLSFKIQDDPEKNQLGLFYSIFLVHPVKVENKREPDGSVKVGVIQGVPINSRSLKHPVYFILNKDLEIMMRIEKELQSERDEVEPEKLELFSLKSS